MSSLDRQEGGSHYKKYAIEPAEFCHKNGLTWCQANVVKYVCRFKDKGGYEDLLKAKHYLDMLTEFEYGDETAAKPSCQGTSKRELQMPPDWQYDEEL